MLYNKVNKFNKSPKGLVAIIASIKQALYMPGKSIIIILLMTFALFLAVASYVLWKNTDAFFAKWQESVEITVYLKKKIDFAKVEELVEELKTNSLIAKLRVIDPDDGLKVFMEETSLQTLLTSFKENPLPGVIVIYPQVKKASKEGILAFIKKLNNYPEVDIVKADLNWLEQSHSWLNLLTKLILFFVFMLIANALLVIVGVSFTNAQILANRYHISKILLQYQFAWYGLISSLLALFLVRIISVVLKYHDILLVGCGVWSVILIVFISLVLSLVSSRIASSGD